MQGVSEFRVQGVEVIGQPPILPLPLSSLAPLTRCPFLTHTCMGSPFSGGRWVHSAIFSSTPAMIGSSPRLHSRGDTAAGQPAMQRARLPFNPGLSAEVHIHDVTSWNSKIRAARRGSREQERVRAHPKAAP